MTADFATLVGRAEPAVGNWVTLPEPSIAELFAAMDFDFVTVDVEHSPASLETALSSVRAIDAAGTGTASVVRLPGHDADVIKRVLDCGVDAVMAPMVDTVAEARALVEACRYPPEGVRGVGPGRASTYGRDLAATVAADDEGFALIAQVESPEGVENAPAIAAVDGVDAVFVGPTDLSVAMGEFEERNAAFQERVTSVPERVDAAGADAAVGTFAVGTEAIERWAGAGFDFLAIGFDGQYLLEGSQRALETFESAMSE